MKHLKIIVFSIAVFNLASVKAQTDDSKTFNTAYSIAPIPNIADFFKLNQNEKFQDSVNLLINKKLDSLPFADSAEKESGYYGKKDFRNNRSRIFMDSYTNEKLNPENPEFKLGLPTPCDCFTAHDTMFIYMGIGFFGGFGFNITVSTHNFQSSFFDYTDDYKPYKYSLSDTASYNYITKKNKYQFLILDKKPSFTIGQQLTGYLTYTTNSYYQKTSGNNFDNIFVSGKLYFTCKTRQRTPYDILMNKEK